MSRKKDIVTGVLIGVGGIIVLGALISVTLYVGFSFFRPASAPSYAPQEDLAKKESLSPSESSTQKSKQDQAQGKTETQKRLVIRNKSIDMEVKNTPKAYRKVETITEEHGGHIAYSSTSTEDQTYSAYQEEQTQSYSPSYSQPYSGELVPSPSQKQKEAAQSGARIATIVAKIPVEDFAQAQKEIKKLGKIRWERQSQEDVTQQNIDLKARLRNLEREEKRYLEFYDAAKTVDDMLKIEAQLSNVRSQIESLKAQIDYLETNASLATLTLHLHEPKKVVRPSGYDWGFVKAITQAIQNFVKTINVLIVVVGTILPLIIIGLAVWILVITLKKQKKQ